MYERIQLPYGYSGLEPYYDTETLKVHYDKLYKGYVDNYNATISKLEEARKTGNYNNLNMKHIEKDLAFFGSGAILHTLFFENMQSAINLNPIPQNLQNDLIKEFGSIANFKKEFALAATNIEGNGWTILGYVPEFKRLMILNAEKHQDLTQWGIQPLLVLDMWEHSYFLKHLTDKAKYIEDFWEIVNWDIVNERFNKIKK